MVVISYQSDLKGLRSLTAAVIQINPELFTLKPMHQ